MHPAYILGQTIQDLEAIRAKDDRPIYLLAPADKDKAEGSNHLLGCQ